MDLDSLTWGLAETEHNGYPVLLRFREFPEGLPKSKYPRRINIFWRMSDVDENGLPADEEFHKLATFEDRLINAVEHDEHSILVAAITSNGEKEFVFYTADVPQFIRRLTNMPQETKPYPITIQTYEDPDWNYYNAVIPNDF